VGPKFLTAKFHPNQKWVNGRGHRTDRQTDKLTNTQTRKVIIRVA